MILGNFNGILESLNKSSQNLNGFFESFDEPQKRKSTNDSSLQRSVKISNEITEFREKAKVQCSHFEDELLKAIDQSTHRITQWIAGSNSDKTKIDMDGARRVFEDLKNAVSGYPYSQMENWLSVSNNELALILSEPDDTKRGKNFGAFYSRKFRSIVQRVNDMVNDSFDKEYEFITHSTRISKGKANEVKNLIATEREAICTKLRDYIQKSRKEVPDFSLRLRDIANQFGWDYFGDEDFEIHSLKYADEADETSLAVIYSDREAETTSAGAFLTAPRLMPAHVNFIRCGFREIGAALAKVAQFMIDGGVCVDYKAVPEQTEKNGVRTGKGSVIGNGTHIESFTSIGDNVIIGKNCRIGSSVFIGSGCRIGDNVTILSGSRIGVNCHYHYEEDGCHKSFAGIGVVVIKEGVEIGANTVIQRGTLSNTVIGDGTIIGNLVEIAHDVKIGRGCLIVSQVGICGNAVIGDRVQIYGQSGIAERVKIGNGAVILAKSGVTKNIKDREKVSGMFSRHHIDELKMIARINKIAKTNDRKIF